MELPLLFIITIELGQVFLLMSSGLSSSKSNPLFLLSWEACVMVVNLHFIHIYLGEPCLKLSLIKPSR